MSTKHTPGPWDICVSANSNLIHVEQANFGEQICTTNKGDKATRLANAKLISVAPEMLNLLKAIRRDMNLDNSPFNDLVNDLIRKATGGAK